VCCIDWTRSHRVWGYQNCKKLYEVSLSKYICKLVDYWNSLA